MTSVSSMAERLGFDEEEQESIKIMTSSVFVGAMIGGMFEANTPFGQMRNERAGAVLGLAAGLCAAASMNKPVTVSGAAVSHRLGKAGYSFQKWFIKSETRSAYNDSCSIDS